MYRRVVIGLHRPLFVEICKSDRNVIEFVEIQACIVNRDLGATNIHISDIVRLVFVIVNGGIGAGGPKQAEERGLFEHTERPQPFLIGVDLSQRTDLVPGDGRRLIDCRPASENRAPHGSVLTAPDHERAGGKQVRHSVQEDIL